MNSSRDYLVYLEDMLNSVVKGLSFIKGFDFDTFKKDEKTQYALIRAIEITGEASKKIPKHIKDKYAEIPWRKEPVRQYFIVVNDIKPKIWNLG
jgi:uncharacterized protein with HEPN domain